MSNRILFKRFSQCVFPIDEKPLMRTFSIWTNGNFYYEYKDYDIPENCETELVLELIKTAKIRSKKKLIFKSINLATKIKSIINHYRTAITELPNQINNNSILDGYTDHIQFGTKKIWGGNILTHLPYTRSSWFESASEEEKENQIHLELISKIYLEIENAINDFRDKIHDFAFNNLKPFKDEETMLAFGKKCEELGFIMDSGKQFYKKYPDIYKSENKYNRKIEKILDIELLGSAVYSKWRYYTNWALPTEEKPVEWFNSIMKHLGQLTIECFTIPSMEKKDLLKIKDIPKDYFIVEYYETNNLIYFSACKEKECDDFYNYGEAPFLITRAKWKKKDEWFSPNVYVEPEVYIETQKCKNLADIIENGTPWERVIKGLLDKADKKRNY